MSDNVDYSSSSSNEINLLDLLQILWASRIILALSTIVFSSLGILFAIAHTPVYEGKVRVHQLDSTETAGFDAWNEGVRFTSLVTRTNPETDTGGEFLVALPEITSKSLADTFTSSYQRGDGLKDALRKHSTAAQNFDGDEQDFELMLNEMLNNFALTEDAKSREVNIVFTTTDKKESLKILSSALGLISKNSKADILNSIHSKLEAKKLTRKFKLDRITTEFEGHLRLYEARKKRSLTLLREQADIARKLGIEIPAYTIPFSPRQAQNHEVPALGLDTFESYYFMQGYSAIEKQIDNIEQRDEDQNSAFVADIDQLVLDRIIAEKNHITDMMMPLWEKLPLHDQDFRLVRVDLAKINFEAISDRRLIVILFTLAGLLITLVFILISDAFKKRRVN